MSVSKAHIVAQLQKEILLLQGSKPSPNSIAVNLKLGPMLQAFPNATFPVGAIHEFISASDEDTAATSGFISGLLAPLVRNGGTLAWISSSRILFPPALKHFGIEPDRIIFVDLQKEKELLWSMEEALKCGALAAVVGEITDISFTASRRLQLAVEQSQVTGFVLRRSPRQLNTTACVTRWKITPLMSESEDDLPGIHFPRWNVELLKVRNGKPASWQVEWVDGTFAPVYTPVATLHEWQAKTG